MSSTAVEQPTKSQSPESLRVEEARIREAYEKRRGDDTRYSWFSPGHLFMVQALEQQLLALLRRYNSAPLTSKKILEIGCGNGHWLREFIKWGAKPENTTGVDLLVDRFAEAKNLCPDGVSLHCMNANRLEFEDSTFDLVLQCTVFTSILDATMKRHVAREMLRVLKNDGLILWYDYHMDNPKNQDVKGVASREIHELFPECVIQLERATLAPPIARLLAPYSWTLCYLLERVPWLCTHYVGVIRKNQTR
jgi:ubiquinone/menaquinone biosynthesis C-methylase UbiE